MSRRLIICADGTWQSEDASAPSNVWRLADRIADTGRDGKPQLVFYQPGVGTDPTRGVINRKFSEWAGGGLGIGLDRNIIDIYHWLIHEYQHGDELWFFGFSRGAYTVRSAVGLLRNCGIIKPAHARLIERAMALYRARDPDSHPNAPRSRSFRRNYAHDVREVQFVGVWDTVGALGVPPWLGVPANLFNRSYRFHDTRLSSIVKHACHALAIDEQRRTFTHALWTEEANKPFGNTVEQVWFPGVHSDVGGGYDDRALGDITLTWMLERATRLELGVRLEEPLQPDHTGPQHDSRWPPHKWPVVRKAAVREREISAGHGQSIHQSAIDRMNDIPDYRPGNIQTAMQGGVPVSSPWNASAAQMQESVHLQYHGAPDDAQSAR
jgi:uncharacterized protein (DUF2235 family)